MIIIFRSSNSTTQKNRGQTMALPWHFAYFWAITSHHHSSMSSKFRSPKSSTLAPSRRLILAFGTLQSFEGVFWSLELCSWKTHRIFLLCLKDPEDITVVETWGPILSQKFQQLFGMSHWATYFYYVYAWMAHFWCFDRSSELPGVEKDVPN